MIGNNYQEKASAFTAMLKAISAKLLVGKIVGIAKSEFNKEVSIEIA